MDTLRKEHAKLVERAKAHSGVKELMEVYDRFLKANEITSAYLKLIAPATFQSNSNRSLLPD